MDQTIEETINKDTQIPGGTRGFSMKKGAVSKHYITADYRASCVWQMRYFVNRQRLRIKHSDLSRPRIHRDEEDMKSLLEMFQNIWQNPFSKKSLDLCNMSTGAIVEPELISDVLNAREKGKETCEQFISERLSSSRSKKFFDSLPRIKLKSFDTASRKKVKSTNKEVMLKANKNLLCMMTLISQNEDVDMKDVLAHPLGPIHWSLACNDRTLRKTNKAAIGKILKTLTLPSENISENSACVIDAMSVDQKTKGNHKTFQEVAETLFVKVLAEGNGSSRLDVIFDAYREKSIKNAERKKRANTTTAQQYKNILATHKIKQWHHFLQSASNKANLIRFLCNAWKVEPFRSRLGDKHLYLGYDEECLKLTKEKVEAADHLRCNHEEADTRMLLHAKDVAFSNEAIIIVSEDTDVLILAAAKAFEIGSNIYQERGNQTRTRFVNVTEIGNILATVILSCLPGLHAFTGCDSVSAFAGKGKATALKLVRRQANFQQIFSEFGEQLGVCN